MKLHLPGPERSIPTDVPYRSERVVAFARDVDVPDGASDAEALAALAQARRLQFLDLDAQEAEVRRRYDSPEPSGAPEPAKREQLASLRSLVKELERLTMQPVELAAPRSRDAAAKDIRQLGAEIQRLKGGKA